MAKITSFMRVTKTRKATEGDAKHKVVKYVRRGQGERISKELLTIVQYIQAHYEVPVDFERSHKFGPHSGMTFEKRLVRAYLLHLLALKSPARKQQPPEIMCITCAKLGHSHRECPDGF